MPTSDKVEFEGHDGNMLSARIEFPSGHASAWAVLAHCFSCSKDLHAARHLAGELLAAGYGVLRFDFAGLGNSEGAFEDTNFTTNVQDLVRASDWLASEQGGDQVLVGHSLGGAAAIVAAGHLPHAKAVATIGAPSSAEHVLQAFAGRIDDIETTGEAEVSLAGRPFRIKQQFLEDVRAASVTEALANLRRPYLVLHSPVDETVGIDNATGLFVSAKHPKSFISLDNADHLMTRPADARRAGALIAAWAKPYLAEATAEATPLSNEVLVSETGGGKYENRVQMGQFETLADEPVSMGGGDKGADPYRFVSAGLGACTSITLRMYANRKGWDVQQIKVGVDHARTHAEDCADCEAGKKVDVFERQIEIIGNLDADQRARMLEIADKCPVHKAIEGKSHVRTLLVDASQREST